MNCIQTLLVYISLFSLSALFLPQGAQGMGFASAPDNTQGSYVEEQSRESGLHKSGSIAVAVLFMALFNFGFCCCCWCLCRALESLNRPFRQPDRRGGTGSHSVAVRQHANAGLPVEMSQVGSQPPQESIKMASSAVIVSPGGDIEIGIPVG